MGDWEAPHDRRPARRRMLGALAAVALVPLVAFLARPGTTTPAPEPFVVERGTPEPRPETSTEPEADRDTETPRLRPARLVVQRLDPATLRPSERAFETSVDTVGGVWTFASPDGRRLALSTVNRIAPAELRVLDLFDPRRIDSVALPVWPHEVSFTPEGDGIVWATHGTLQQPAALGLVPVPGAGLPAPRVDVVSLPTGLELLDVQALGDGLAGVLGHDRLDGGRLGPLGPPRLVVVDLASGAPVVDVVLPASDGRRGGDAGDGAGTGVQPGVAWDPERGRAYVVHADRDAVLVVDLATGEVVDELLADADASEPASARDHHWRRAELGDDGRTLVAYGARTDPRSGIPRPLPLLVADVVTGRVRLAQDAAFTRVLALGGGTILAFDEHPAAGRRPELAAVDGDTLEVRWRHELDGGWPIQAQLLDDGRAVLLLRDPSLVPATLLTTVDADGVHPVSGPLPGGVLHLDARAGVLATLRD